MGWPQLLGSLEGTDKEYMSICIYVIYEFSIKISSMYSLWKYKYIRMFRMLTYVINVSWKFGKYAGNDYLDTGDVWTANGGPGLGGVRDVGKGEEGMVSSRIEGREMVENGG